MVNLPSASKIPVLTPENIMLVAQAHLGQLRNGSSRDEFGAETFVKETLQLWGKQAQSWKQSYDNLAETFAITLRHTPHFKHEMPWKLPADEVSDWAEANSIKFELVHHLFSAYYLFDTHDDAILFKLRWA